MSTRREFEPDEERVVEGEIVGYRVWALSSSGGLRSPVNLGFEWTPGVNTAACERALGHAGSLNGCSCGLYALHEPPRPYDGQVLGAVCAWGEVGVRERGFRAEHARIVALAAPERGHCQAEASRAAARYRVPLVPLDRLAAVASEHGSPVAHELRPSLPRARCYEALARPVRRLALLRWLLLALGAYGAVITLGWWAWLASADAVHARGADNRHFALAAVPCLLGMAVTLARAMGGPRAPATIGRLAVTTIVLWSGLLAPWMTGVSVRADVTVALTAVAGAVARLTREFRAIMCGGGCPSRVAPLAMLPLAFAAALTLGCVAIGFGAIGVSVLCALTLIVCGRTSIAACWSRADT